MPLVSVLSQLFNVSRYRPRASAGSGFATPVMGELYVGDRAEVAVTNLEGCFVIPGKSSNGVIRHAFMNCPIEQEEIILIRLVEFLTSGNLGRVLDSISEALDDFSGERVCATNTPLDELKVRKVEVSSNFPFSLVLPEREHAGLCVRSGDYVSLVVFDFGAIKVVKT